MHFLLLQFNGREIRYNDLILLFNTDNPKKGGMGVAFKLGTAHIFPSTFEKMNVKLMAQVY